MKCKKCKKDVMYAMGGLCEECVISPDEKRMIRREFINEYLHLSFRESLSEIKYYVRFLERVNCGYELRVYHVDR